MKFQFIMDLSICRTDRKFNWAHIIDWIDIIMKFAPNGPTIDLIDSYSYFMVGDMGSINAYRFADGKSINDRFLDQLM